ncbi:hypothetical protein [Pseudoxanthomonas sp. UTMC 1351]|uniref:hypothetical protein n=1 Tax=Pseudoxanthomonas sp. UTMC 1351 TaxID=2695853 RepID=UPI0034CE8354
MEIAPAGIPKDLPLQSRAAKNRSIAAPVTHSRPPRGKAGRSVGQRMFSKASGFFRYLAKALRTDVSAHDARSFAQDRAIAEQDSDIASTAFIARISPVPGAARAAVREKAAMSLVVAQSPTQAVTAAEQHGDAGARATWWQPLPQLLSRLRRALHAPSASVTDNIPEIVGARSTQWSFAPQAREFAVSRRLQSGGRIRAPRSPRVLRP